MSYRLGFIGGGKMATAIMQGALRARIVEADDVLVSDVSKERLDELKRVNGILTTSNNKEIVTQCQYIILAVKPQTVFPILGEIANAITQNTVIISIVAGLKTEQIQSILPANVHVLRTMPNTPLLVAEGMTAFSLSHNLTEEQLGFVTNIFESLGEVTCVEEEHMDAVTAVSGSGPAYVYLFIDALAQAGISEGLSCDTAYHLARQTVMGAAKMVHEPGRTPRDLIAEVCSPGGTTIEALGALEKRDFRGIIAEAVHSACEKSKKLADSAMQQEGGKHE